MIYELEPITQFIAWPQNVEEGCRIFTHSQLRTAASAISTRDGAIIWDRTSHLSGGQQIQNAF